MYGFDDFFKNLPPDLQRLDFIKSNRGYYGRQQEEVSFEIPLPADIDIQKLRCFTLRRYSIRITRHHKLEEFNVLITSKQSEID